MDNTTIKKDTNEILDTIINLLGIDTLIKTELSVENEDDNSFDINISWKGDDVGLLIGPHGKFIQSLEQIISLMLLKKIGHPEDIRIFVNLDINNYRKEKDDKIVQMALQKADDARILGEPVDLSPMPARVRRIIHMTLKKFDDITTESFGEGKERFVRITPNIN